MNRKTVKLISTCLLAYIVIMSVTIILGSLADEGVILDAWYSMLDYIPFGNKLAPLCITLFSDSFSMGKNMADYLLDIKGLTPLDFFEDTATLVLTAVFFEAVNNFLQTMMGIKKRHGIHYVLMQMICGMVSALACTLVASIVLHFLCQQLVVLPDFVQGLVSVLVTVITVGGAIGILFFVLESGIVASLIFVFVKIIGVNVLKVLVTYAGILFVLLFLSEKAYLQMFTAFAGWGAAIIILIGIDMMLSSVFEH